MSTYHFTSATTATTTVTTTTTPWWKVVGHCRRLPQWQCQDVREISIFTAVATFTFNKLSSGDRRMNNEQTKKKKTQAS